MGKQIISAFFIISCYIYIIIQPYPISILIFASLVVLIFLIKLFSKNHITEILIFIILIFTAYEWLQNLSVNPLDIDELFTLNIIYINDLYSIIKFGNILDNHPPLYHILMYVFIKIFGVSEYTIRIPSVIFSVLSVYLTFILSKKLFSGIDGLVSALVMIILIPNAWIVQYARGYSLLLLFSVLTMIFLVDIIKYKENIKQIIPYKLLALYTFSALCCVYTHYFGCVLIFSELLFLLLFFYRSIIKEIMIIVISITVLYGPWFLFSYPKKVPAINPNFMEWINWNVFGCYNCYILIGLIFISILPFLHSITINKNIKLSLKEHTLYFLMLFLFLFPYLLICCIHNFLINCCQYKYLIIAIVPFYILIAHSIVILGRKRILIFLFTIIFLISAIKQKNNFIPFLNNTEYPLKFIINNYNKTKKPILFIDKYGLYNKYYKYHCDKYLNKSTKNDIKFITEYDEKTIMNEIDTFSNFYHNQYVWLFDCSSVCDVNEEATDKDVILFNKNYPKIYLIRKKVLTSLNL